MSESCKKVAMGSIILTESEMSSACLACVACQHITSQTNYCLVFNGSGTQQTDMELKFEA